MEKLFKEYSKFLDESKKHLNHSAIALYINLYDQLSEKEKRFIESHINNCDNCKNLLNKQFDEDFEIDDEVDLIHLESQEGFDFTSSNEDFAITFIEKEKSIYLSIQRLPENYQNTNILLKNINSEIECRIISAKSNLYYKTELSNLNDLNKKELTAEIIKKESFSFKKKINTKYYYWYSAAALIIIALAISFYLNFNNSEKHKINSANRNGIAQNKTNHLDTSESKSEEGNEKLLAYAYKENSVLENFVDRNIRSAESVEIISPKNGTTVKQIPFYLKWSGVKSKNYNIVIVNNQNKIIFSRDVLGSKLEIKNKIEPGLYYWKINYNNKLEAVGKFKIK